MFNDIEALSSLLTASAGDAASAPTSAAASLRPSDLMPAPRPAAVGSSAAAGVRPAATAADARDIWAASEVTSTAEDAAAANDGRKRPEFEIMFKQSVAAEDVYFGLSGKTPSTVDCDFLTVRVLMAGESARDLDVRIDERELNILSARYRLHTYLPHRVRHKDGTAAWDAKAGTLTLTLPIVKDELF